MARKPPPLTESQLQILSQIRIEEKRLARLRKADRIREARFEITRLWLQFGQAA